MALYLIGAAIAFATLMLMPSSSAKTIAYSEFRQMVRTGQVAEVVVTEQRIRGTTKTDARAFETTRIDDPHLYEELDAHGVKSSGQADSGWWTAVAQWLLPLFAIVLLWSFVLGRANPARGVMGFERSRAKIYAEDDVKVTFADVAGIDEATEELREVVEFLRNPKKYTDLGGRIPKGVLLLGPPGTGKTLLARAVAGEARVPFFSLSGSEFVEMFVGVGAARVRDLFEQTETKAPCIVFIDELDALGKTRVQSQIATHEEREQTLNQLLAEMDGFDARKGVIVMAATNRPEVLDPALLRAGRFDRQIVVDRPNVEGREAILRLHARTVKLGADVDLKVVAARTAGCAGADLANLINEATLLAARKDRREVTMDDFEEALDRLVAGLKHKRVMSAHEREIIAYHEAGHAVVATVLPDVDPVHKISIVQRGYEALGHTLQLAAQEHYLVSRPALLNQLAVLLGGRAAEEIVFSEISTGAQNDLQRATDLARAMVVEYGMSGTLGPVAFGDRRRSVFLDIPGLEARPFAEETAREIDAEIRELVIDAHARALELLRARRKALDSLARRLLEHEVVDGTEVRALVEAEARTAPPESALA
jgi:cell division protease FtsH